MKKTTKKTAKPVKLNDYLAMSADALREATKKYDKPVDITRFPKMNPKTKARWDRALKGGVASVRVKNVGGRPRMGDGSGAVIVPVSMERSLLEQVDAYAKDKGVKRSPVIAMALQEFMRAATAKPLPR